MKIDILKNQNEIVVNNAAVQFEQLSIEDITAEQLEPIVAITRSLSQSLAEKHIRVNALAPGPVWTPLIPSTFPAEKVKSSARILR